LKQSDQMRVWYIIGGEGKGGSDVMRYLI